MLEGLGDKKRLAEVNRILKNGWFCRGGLACLCSNASSGNLLFKISLPECQLTDSFDFCLAF